MRILKTTGIEVPEKIAVSLHGVTQDYYFFAAGSYNVAYLSPDRQTIVKVWQSELNPAAWEKQADGKKLARLVALTDSPVRSVRLWNRYTLPRLRAAAAAAGLKDDLPELMPARLCDVVINGITKKTWACPCLQHEGDRLDAAELNGYQHEAYRGNSELGIPGGRVLVDLTCGNVIRWQGVVVPLDFGAFFSLTELGYEKKNKTFRREASQISLDVWYDDSDAEEEMKFNRADVFREWIGGHLAQLDRYKDTYLLTAAILFVAENVPEYLDLSVFTTNHFFRNKCAFAFLKNELPCEEFKKVFPQLRGFKVADIADSLTYQEIILRYELEKAERRSALRTKKEGSSFQEHFAKILADLQSAYENSLEQEAATSPVISFFPVEKTSGQLQKIIREIEKQGVESDFSKLQHIDFQHMMTDFEGCLLAQNFCHEFMKLVHEIPLMLTAPTVTVSAS